MSFLRRFFQRSSPWEQAIALERAQPGYVAFEDYLAIKARIKDEPVDMALLTQQDVDLLIRSLFDSHGVIRTGGGWRGLRGESYVCIGMWMPTVNENADPETFARKEIAIHTAKHRLERAYEKGVIQRLISEAKEAFLDNEAAL